MDNIISLQDTCPEIMSMKEFFINDRTGLDTCYTPQQERYAEVNDTMTYIVNEKILPSIPENDNKSKDLHYSFYNFDDMINNIENNKYLNKNVNTKIVNLFNKRFKYNLNAILFSDGIRDYELESYEIFIKDFILKKDKGSIKDKEKKKEKKKKKQP
jgi:hypothetical protein